MRTKYILLGVVLGILFVPITLLVWLRFGHPPVAVSDAPLPLEKMIVEVPMGARIHRELVKTPPIQPTEANFFGGAMVYRENCAVCHRVPGKPANIGAKMYPDAPPLWEQHHGNGTVGVSDDEPGETYWKVNNGIRLTGMPSFKVILSETEMWQVSQLLANANKPMSQRVLDVLRGEPSAASGH